MRPTLPRLSDQKSFSFNNLQLHCASSSSAGGFGKALHELAAGFRDGGAERGFVDLCRNRFTPPSTVLPGTHRDPTAGRVEGTDRFASISYLTHRTSDFSDDILGPT